MLWIWLIGLGISSAFCVVIFPLIIDSWLKDVKEYNKSDAVAGLIAMLFFGSLLWFITSVGLCFVAIGLYLKKRYRVPLMEMMEKLFVEKKDNK
jgi:hypothetical protein